jgi:hypothetical protein
MLKIIKTKSQFFEKANKFDKPLASLTMKKKEKTQIKSEMEKGDIMTDTVGIIRSLESIMNNYMPINLITKNNV